MSRARWLSAVVLASAFAAAPAAAAPLYTVSFGGFSSVESATPFRRDTTFALDTSNGTGQFTGGGYAGPGYVSVIETINTTWASAFSGGNTYGNGALAQTTDFLISGPSSPVTGTLHLRAIADFTLNGGFPGNNAHDTRVWVRGEVVGFGNIYASTLGSYLIGNFGPEATGCLSGQTGSHLDVPFDVTGSFPVGAPLTLGLTIQADGFSYGYVGANPGLVQTNAGGAPGDRTGRGLRLDGSSGVVMTLPAGYRLDSPTWGIINSTYPNLAGVEDEAVGADMRLELASANPTRGEARIALTLARNARARVALYDVAGRVIRTLIDGEQTAGRHEYAWDGRAAAGVAAPAGLYFIRAETEGRVVTRRLVRMR